MVFQGLSFLSKWLLVLPSERRGDTMVQTITEQYSLMWVQLKENFAGKSHQQATFSRCQKTWGLCEEKFCVPDLSSAISVEGGRWSSHKENVCSSSSTRDALGSKDVPNSPWFSILETHYCVRGEIVLGKTGLGPWVLFTEIKIAEIDRDEEWFWNMFLVITLLPALK